MTFFLRREAGEWRITSACGGTDHGRLRRGPRAYLGGGAEQDGFFAAGYVDGDGQDVTRVELRFADGTVARDRPVDDIALFVIEGPVQLPVTVSLIGGNGEELVAHPALPE